MQGPDRVTIPEPVLVRAAEPETAPLAVMLRAEATFHVWLALR